MGINERLMKFRFPLAPSCHVTIISVYAPTFQNCEEDKEAFYENLDSLVKDTAVSDKLFILGGFNTQLDVTVKAGRECWVPMAWGT